MYPSLRKSESFRIVNECKPQRRPRPASLILYNKSVSGHQFDSTFPC